MFGVERRDGQPGAAPGAQPLGEPGREQGLGQALDPGGAQAQVGGRLDDHTGRHLGPPTGTTDTAAKSVRKMASTGKLRFNLAATNGQVIATSLATVMQAALIPVACWPPPWPITCCAGSPALWLGTRDELVVAKTIRKTLLGLPGGCPLGAPVEVAAAARLAVGALVHHGPGPPALHPFAA
jgi:hypothetical protein